VNTSHYELVDLFDVTRRTLQDCSSVLQGHGIEVTMRIPANGPSMLMDRSKVAKAIENILRVTASYAKKGDKMLIECKNTEDRVLVCFADNSTGLPGDAVSRLVMPFGDADTTDDKKRALSLAGEIIQKHAGEILIKSSMSWKTILILSFPKKANRDRRSSRRERRHRQERRSAVSTR
jgi:signal transduction histidine kinase